MPGLSRKQLNIIRDNYEEMTSEELAAHVGCPLDEVIKALKRMSLTPKGIDSIKAGPMWQNLRRKFNNDEIKFYEYQYNELMKQLGEDVVTTEQIQVNQLITNMIMAERNLSEQKEIRGDVARIKSDIDNMEQAYPPDEERPAKVISALVSLYDRVANLNNRLVQVSNEYKNLEGNQSRILSDLKATRNQRLERVQERTKNFMSLIQELSAEENKEQYGRQAEIFRQAAIKKQAELSELYKFDDDTFDQIVITPENQ